jgi:predicted unusual protein kinase regulating ubiquinone biosynthesis (AarF/ABC1/UbiB family)
MTTVLKQKTTFFIKSRKRKGDTMAAEVLDDNNNSNNNNGWERLTSLFKQTVQWGARQYPVLTKLVQIAVNNTDNDMLKFLLSDVGGNTFTSLEEKEMASIVVNASGVYDNSYSVIGCGTIGRVYRVGNKALKVKIPGIVEKMQKDLAWLIWMAKGIDFVTLEKFHLLRYLNSLSKSIHEQYDFVREVYNTRSFMKSLEVYGLDTFVSVPKVDMNLSNENVIVMEYVQGKVLANATDEDIASVRAAYGPSFDDSMAKMWIANILLMDMFHLDLHAGNMIISDKDKKLYMIDFGLCCPRLDNKQLLMLMNVMRGFFTEDPELLARALGKEYYLDSSYTKNILSNKVLFNEFLYRIIHNYHVHYTCPFNQRFASLIKEASQFGADFPVYGNSNTTAVEMGALQSMSVLLRLGVSHDAIQRQIKWGLETNVHVHEDVHGL